MAFNAIVFLYVRVLERLLSDIGETIHTKRQQHLPVVMGHAEAISVIAHLQASYDSLARLMNGASLCVMEAARSRAMDIDFTT